MCSSGGPTRPRAPATPGIVWQLGQPKRGIAARPASGSPPVSAAAASCAVSCTRYQPQPAPPRPVIAATPSAAMARVRDTLRGGMVAGLRGAQPCGAQGKGGADIDHAGGDPHDQPAELLILQRRQPP